LWDLDANSPESSWELPGGMVLNVDFAADNRHLVLAQRGMGQAPLASEILSLDTTTGQLRSALAVGVAEYRALNSLTAVAYSSDGLHIAGGRDKGAINLWNIAKSHNRKLRGHPDDVMTLDFSRDGSLLASAGLDQTVRLWNVASSTRRAVLHGHRGAITALSFAPDGRTLASAGRDRMLIFWDVAAGKARATRQAHESPVECLAYSPDGRTLATGGAAGTIKLWDMRTFQEVASWKGHAGTVRELVFAPDGRLLASGGDTRDGQSEILLWRADKSPGMVKHNEQAAVDERQ
jgi:WD40 repeat protein